ncbi:MAG: circularly permuted type 2 ATP-grasp protein [Coriobacteriales bacterium]|nr:circularly permuted type 2 ATP-grasp protein [Coriobacteriales bacterium]
MAIENPRGDMRKLEAEYIAIMESLDGDVAGRNAVQDYLESSTAIYQGHVIEMSFVPKLFDAKTLKYIDEIQKTTYSILSKVMQHYIDDPEYAALFRFAPELDRLIRIPTGYSCPIPIGRFDIFLDEETFEFSFCEFNTDGSSAMNEEREAGNSLCRTATFDAMCEHHTLTAQDLFDGWVDAFAEIYASYDAKVDDPLIAICDYRNSGNPDEFGIFRDRFIEKGHRCEIVYIDELECREDGLYSKGGLKIDAVYRRAVTAEVMDALEGLYTPEEQAGTQALCEAYARHQVCLIGGFNTHIAHCKQIFQVLCNPMTSEFLTEEEREFVAAHIPFTAFLVPEEVDMADVLTNKDEWIIKPTDRYSSKGVCAGMEHEPEAWRALIEEHTGRDYVVQRYCKQYKTINCRPRPLDEELQPWNNLVGYFNYNGKFAGIYVRAGRNGLIVGYDGGITVGTFLVDVDLDELGIDIRTRIPVRD